MRFQSLRRDANSNANGVAEGEIFKSGGERFPQLEAVGRLGAGQRPCPSESHVYL